LFGCADDMMQNAPDLSAQKFVRAKVFPKKCVAANSLITQNASYG
jgi:hypothetical protein